MISKLFLPFRIPQEKFPSMVFVYGIFFSALEILAKYTVTLAILFNEEVVSGKFVPALAMGLTHLFRRGRFTSSVVLPRSHGFEMGWVYAVSNFAKMIDLESSWNWTLKLFVRYAMNIKMFLANRDLSILSSWVNVALPFPAAGYRIYGNFRDETFSGGFIHQLHCTTGDPM